MLPPPKKVASPGPRRRGCRRPSRLPALLVGLGLGLGLVAAISPAEAKPREAVPPSLLAARARFADLDFEGALSAFSTLVDDASTPARVRAAALTGRGLCLQVLGRPKEARASFLESLAIDPKQALPEDTSPKLRRPFLAARKIFRQDYAPTLALDRAALASGQLVITTRDPLGLIASVEVLLTASGKLSTLKARARGDGAFEASFGASGGASGEASGGIHGRAQLRARALNLHGIELATLGTPKALAIRLPRSEPPPKTEPIPTPPKTEPAKTVVTSATSGPTPKSDDRPPPADAPHPSGLPTDPTVSTVTPPVATLVPDRAEAIPRGPTSDAFDARAPAGRPLAYAFAGGAAAALGGAIALGLSARTKARAFNGDPLAFASQSEALATGRAARSSALGANLLYGGAALLAGSAALFAFWNPATSSDQNTLEDPIFALAPTPDGAVLLLGGRFR